MQYAILRLKNFPQLIQRSRDKLCYLNRDDLSTLIDQSAIPTIPDQTKSYNTVAIHTKKRTMTRKTGLRGKWGTFCNIVTLYSRHHIKHPLFGQCYASLQRYRTHAWVA